MILTFLSPIVFLNILYFCESESVEKLKLTVDGTIILVNEILKNNEPKPIRKKEITPNNLVLSFVHQTLNAIRAPKRIIRILISEYFIASAFVIIVMLLWSWVTANVMALRCWGISERQTNQQQKAKLEKQMYTTLTVSPNIVKPLLNEGSY